MGRYIQQFTRGNYSERDGGPGGRVGKKDFSVDGRSWNFRDPRNQQSIDKANQNREKGRVVVNPQSVEKFDALYDYDFGTVRDAAKELGIGNVDEKKEVKQILKYIQQGRGNKEQTSFSQPETQQQPEPLLPRGERVPRFNEPMPQAPSMSNGAVREGSSDANMAAIRGGDDLNEWYQTKFVPHLEADANATTSEIGDDSRYFLDKFVFNPPKLGSVKDIFDKYKGEIEDLD